MVYIYSNVEWTKKFLIFKVLKSWVASKYKAQKLKRPRKKNTKKAIQILYGQKDHLPWIMGNEK